MMEATRELDETVFAASEPYMNDRQLAYFKNKLIVLKMDLTEKANQKKGKIKEIGVAQPDILDKSNTMAQVEQDIRSYERNRQLIRQINDALRRIEDGSFGYCKITGDEIGLKRLEALPFTPVSIEALKEIETRNQRLSH